MRARHRVEHPWGAASLPGYDAWAGARSGGTPPAVPKDVTPLVVLDLTGTFAFALNGALTALRAARLDVVGAVLCFALRMVGVRFDLDAPYPLAPPPEADE